MIEEWYSVFSPITVKPALVTTSIKQ